MLKTKQQIMKKLQLLTGALLVASSVFAQKAETSKKAFVQTKKTVKTMSAAKSVAIWSDDFSDPSTWVIEHDATACDLDWQIGTGLATSGGAAIATIASTSADNGYAMIDSDLYGGDAGGSEVEDSWFTTASSIDLSASTNVVLQYEAWYKSWNAEKCFIVTSTNNTDWPDLTPDFDASTNVNVYEAFPGVSGVSSEELASNPTLSRLNISPSAGGESQVWVRFHWTGTWGYAWFVDDVAILEQPANDIVLNSAWVSTTAGYEYGRTPYAHQKDSVLLGGEVFNFGINDQTNVEISMNVKDASGSSVLLESASIASLENDSTDFTQSVLTGVSLDEGVYEFSTVATSDADNANGANFGNNSYSRNFEITKNIFSIDGIGVYSDDMSTLGYIGTNWGNGTIVMARYEILSTTNALGLQLAITNFTDAGGQVFPFLVTEETIASDDMSSSNRIGENEDGIMITQDHIDNGIINVDLIETELTPGVYYACVELYTGPNEDDGIYILDDETVAQPGSASMFHYLEEAANYTNGTAAAIRLVTDDVVGIEEAKTALFSVSPNPSNGVFTVIANNVDTYTLEIINVLGEVVSTKSIEGTINETINVSNLNAGVYFVKVATATTQNVQRVVIK
jgi:hypothetical protein